MFLKSLLLRLRVFTLAGVLPSLILGLLHSSYARETDQFSHRLTTLPELHDSAGPLNEWVNSQLSAALQSLEKQGQSSPLSEEQLVQAVEARLLDPVFRVLLAPVEVWMLSRAGRKELDLDRPKARGIYQRTTPQQVGWSLFAGISYTLNIGGHFVGEDKVGHFFSQGHQYFERARTLEAQGVDPKEIRMGLLAYGHEMELGNLGFVTTGMYSPADLAANWAGWIFWNSLVHGTSENPKPLFELRDGKWKQVRLFRIEDYAGDAWDEVLNPPYAANGRVHAAVQRQIRKVCESWMQKGLSFSGSPPLLEPPGLLSHHGLPERHRVRFECEK